MAHRSLGAGSAGAGSRGVSSDTAPNRAGRPQARSPIPCSRRTAARMNQPVEAFAQTTPALRRSAIQRSPALRRSRRQPVRRVVRLLHGLLRVRNVRHPDDEYLAAIRDRWTPVRVLDQRESCSGRSQAGWYISAPALPSYAGGHATPHICALGMRVDGADVLVLFVLSGLPSAERLEACLQLLEQGVEDRSRNQQGEPAQQTCPWLKKIPLTTPSTAWSSGASSNTMLAALPPSSKREAPVGAGDRAADLLPHRRARERDLVDVGGHEGRAGLPAPAATSLLRR